jgi:hypothetical protein
MDPDYFCDSDLSLALALAAANSFYYTTSGLSIVLGFSFAAFLMLPRFATRWMPDIKFSAAARCYKIYIHIAVCDAIECDADFNVIYISFLRDMRERDIYGIFRASSSCFC